MKTWKKFLAAMVLTGAVANPAWADTDATDSPADATASDAVGAPDAATAADAASPADAATAADGGGDAASAADGAADGTATIAPGDADSGGAEGHSGCSAGTSAGNPLALGLAGAVLGWLISRSRKPVKAPVRNR